MLTRAGGGRQGRAEAEQSADLVPVAPTAPIVFPAPRLTGIVSAPARETADVEDARAVVL
ncbi:hypothetical protein [Streptomyces chartreusis]|uniref:hypothetical protein n=1 Tax=Streptomyces chartreusis TaxID=1969 RepID=UPI003652814D